MKTIFLLAILFMCVSCEAQRKFSNRSIGARDTLGFDDIVGGAPAWSSRIWVDDSANNKVIVKFIQHLLSSINFDSSSFGAGFTDIKWYGSNNRVVANMDRSNSKNLPEIVIDVLDSSNSSGNVTVYATMRALNWTGLKTLAQLGAAANGEVFFSGRRDSSGAFHRFLRAQNDSIGMYIDGTLKWQLTSDGSVAGNTMIRGTDAFSGTSQHDTLVISGVTSSDVYVATPHGAATFSISANDVLGCWAKTDTLIVSRPSSGTSGLGYSYHRYK